MVFFLTAKGQYLRKRQGQHCFCECFYLPTFGVYTLETFAVVLKSFDPIGQFPCFRVMAIILCIGALVFFDHPFVSFRRVFAVCGQRQVRERGPHQVWMVSLCSNADAGRVRALDTCKCVRHAGLHFFERHRLRLAQARGCLVSRRQLELTARLCATTAGELQAREGASTMHRSGTELFARPSR